MFSVDIMPITTVSKNKLFLMKYIAKKDYTRRFNLHSISFLGDFKAQKYIL